MAFAQNAVSGFERLVTRSLAIVALAVAAGAAHSWMHGPLEPIESTENPTAGEIEEPVTGAINGGSDNVDPTPEPAPADVNDTTALPDGHITAAQAYDHLMNGTADFIDARPADEYAEGHIPGALNLSLEMTQDSARVAAVLDWLPDPSRPVVIYCRGGLCTEAKDVARRIGSVYTNILIFDDGFPGWQAADYMVETGPGQ